MVLLMTSRALYSGMTTLTTGSIVGYGLTASKIPVISSHTFRPDLLERTTTDVQYNALAKSLPHLARCWMSEPESLRSTHHLSQAIGHRTEKE